MRLLTRICLSVLLLCVSFSVLTAQDDVPPAPELVAPQPVSTLASDGLILEAHFYVVHPDAPTVVLLHQLYRTRDHWLHYANALTVAGFNVLAPDLRGWGATGGEINWPAAVDDVATWMAWLRNEAQVRPDAISMMGSSMGSSLAINGCFQDELCRTVIAVSPGIAYYGIDVTESVTSLMGERQLFVVYADRDLYPRRAVPRMLGMAPNNITVQSYPGRNHGMDLIDTEWQTFIPLMVQWFSVLGVPQ